MKLKGTAHEKYAQILQEAGYIVVGYVRPLETETAEVLEVMAEALEDAILCKTEKNEEAN